jgi:YHS domain-containing protein
MEVQEMRRTVLAVTLILVLTATSVLVFSQAQKKRPEQAKDPVCLIMVDKNPELSTTHKGETYYFCSKADMEKFKKEPEKYVKKK